MSPELLHLLNTAQLSKETTVTTTHTITLTTDEARLLRDLQCRASGSLAHSRRGLLDRIAEKLRDAGAPCDTSPCARSDLPDTIVFKNVKRERRVLIQPQVGQLIRGLRTLDSVDVITEVAGSQITVRSPASSGPLSQTLLDVPPEGRAVEIRWPWEDTWTTCVTAA